ncbi:MAG TPA: hypothetical protein VHR45_15490 [Thermoanaerobaculia bacterium]|nr:hypothetical protein [Thermoanaerobaculia bacterium]
MNQRLALCSLALTLLAPSTDSALAGDATVLPPVLISADEPGARHVESWLAVNPRDAQNLIAASLVFGERGGVAVYASLDGGQSWQRAVHGPRGEKAFPGLDPAISFARDGDAFLCTSGGDLAVWRSTDGGRTWGEPAAVPGSAYDRPSIASDWSAGPYHDRVYVAGKFPITVFGHPGADVMAISASDDRGRSFGSSRLILPSPERGALHLVGNVITTPDGRLIVPYQTFDWPQPGQTLLRGDHWLITSENGGRSYSEPRLVASVQSYGHADEWRSMKGASMAQIALDSSAGPRRGRLYLVWLDVVEAHYQVFVAASADAGKSWSTPVRVNDNHSTSNQSNPAIAVNEDGTVGVVWNDRRNDARDRCYQPFFAASLDGGASFQPNVEVVKELTCPNGPQTQDGRFDPVNPAHRFLNGGDTQGIVGRPNSSFQLAWLGGSGVMQLWSTTITVKDDRPLMLSSVFFTKWSAEEMRAGGAIEFRGWPRVRSSTLLAPAAARRIRRGAGRSGARIAAVAGGRESRWPGALHSRGRPLPPLAPWDCAAGRRRWASTRWSCRSGRWRARPAAGGGPGSASRARPRPAPTRSAAPR